MIRTETWGEFTKDAPVKVKGEQGKWRFVSHCLNVATGSEWLDIYGGTLNHQSLRAFKAERVTLIKRRTRRKVAA